MSSDKNILIDIWFVSLLAARLVNELIEDSPLAVDEFAIYGLIADLGPVTATDLARGAGMSPTTLSGIVRRCESRGELTRVPNPNDRRSSFLMLTDRGVEVYLGVVPQLQAAIEQLARELGGRHDQVRLALQAVDDSLRTTLGVGERPYRLATADPSGSAFNYSGASLTADQEREVRGYIEWVRTRDTQPAE